MLRRQNSLRSAGTARSATPSFGVITAHLKASAPISWQGLSLDFSGVVFDGGSFSGTDPSHNYFDSAVFSGGVVSFEHAEFASGTVAFNGAVFSGADVFYGWAKFTGARVWFNGAVFTAGMVRFLNVDVSGGEVHFGGAHFSGGHVLFDGFVGPRGRVTFAGAADWSHPPDIRSTGSGPAIELPTAPSTSSDTDVGPRPGQVVHYREHSP